MANRLTVGLCQINSRDDKAANIDRAVELIDEAADRGARLIALPEYVDYLGPKDAKHRIAEPIPGPFTDRLATKARQHGVYIHGGSINETSDVPGKVHNTSVLIAPTGKIVATYRKMHLFDSQIAGNESDYVIAGDDAVLARVDGHLVGMTIAYDSRFPELFRALAVAGAEVILSPSNSTTVTGKDHWHTMLRARAIENQCFVVAPAQVGHHEPATRAYGHSLVVDPWGTVLVDAPDKECIVTIDLDFDYLRKIRREVPSLANRRPEAYQRLIATD
jgi:deaminated glutathione amidase